MQQQQRYAAIMAGLTRRGTVSSTELAGRLGVSVMTVRRDLAQLERDGKLVRVYGGAVAADGGSPATPPTSVVGMIMPSASYYFRDVIAGAGRVAREHGVRLVLGDTHYSASEELRQAERLLSIGVDGMLITPSAALDPSGKLFRLLESVDIPVVIVEREVPSAWMSTLTSVRTDHAHGADAAVQHLVASGCDEVILAARETPTTAEVTVGYRRAMDRLKLTAHEVGLGASPGRVATENLEAALDIACAGKRGALVLTDAEAIALIELAHDRGLEVPDQLSVVAYDDEIAALSAVPLTAVAPPKTELGALAMRTCLLNESGERAARVPQRTVLLPRLIERASTDDVRS